MESQHREKKVEPKNLRRGKDRGEKDEVFGKLGGLPSVLFEFNIGRVLERLRRQDKRKEKMEG